jgi:hypothetical protein
MFKSLGDAAYNAARNQTKKKLHHMHEAFIAIAKDTSTAVQRQHAVCDAEQLEAHKPKMLHQRTTQHKLRKA